MSLGEFLGGAFQGIGAGIATKGRMDAEAASEAAKQDAITLREAWIESTRHGNKLTEMRTESGLRREEQTNQYDLMDRNASRQTARQTASQIAVDKAKTANDMALAKLTSGLQLTREQTLKQQEFSLELAKMGREVDRFERRADGAMVAFSKSGSVISVSPPGLFPPKSSEDDGASLLTGTSPAGGGKPLPTANVASRPPLASFQQ